MIIHYSLSKESKAPTVKSFRMSIAYSPQDCESFKKKTVSYMSYLTPIIIIFTFDSKTYSSENSEILQFLHPQLTNRILCMHFHESYCALRFRSSEIWRFLSCSPISHISMTNFLSKHRESIIYWRRGTGTEFTPLWKPKPSHNMAH